MTYESDKHKGFYDRLDALRLGGGPGRVVAEIWADVTDRRGWRQAADSFDVEVMHEILDRWLEITRRNAVPLSL